MSKSSWDPKNLKQGSHVCSICKNQQEQLSVILPFLFAGLQNSEKCVCVFTEETKNAVLKVLLEAGLDVFRCREWGQFLFFRPEDTYLKNGRFDPARIIEEFAEIERLAVRSGFNGVRIIGETKIFNSGLPGTEKLAEYEAKINNFFKESRIISLCLYEEGAISREILRDAVHTHPEMIIYGASCDNRYYVPPEIFLSGDKSYNGLTYESLRNTLLTE